MITIGSLGVTTDYGDDSLTWLWPWKRPNRESKYVSELGKIYYPTKQAYWSYRGRATQSILDNGMLGINLMHLLVDAAKFHAPKGLVVFVVGHNLDELMAGNASVMSKAKNSILKNSDCVILKMDSTEQASDIMEEIRSKNLGFGMMLSHGHLMMTTAYLSKESAAITRIHL